MTATAAKTFKEFFSAASVERLSATFATRHGLRAAPEGLGGL